MFELPLTESSLGIQQHEAKKDIIYIPEEREIIVVTRDKTL